MNTEHNHIERQFLEEGNQDVLDAVIAKRYNSVIEAGVVAGCMGDLDLELTLYKTAQRMSEICDEARDLIVAHGGPADATPEQMAWMRANALRLKGENPLFGEFFRLDQHRLMV